jgi:hypothetical protein
MTGKHLTPALAALVALAAATQVQCQPQGPTPAQTTPPVAPAGPPTVGEAPSNVTPPAPAFKAGDAVTDRDGTAVGAVQTLVESPAGPMVVVRIDGKLVSLPQATLNMQGTAIVSTQTKAQILAAAGAAG